LSEIREENGEEVSLGLFNSLLSGKYFEFSYFKTIVTFILTVSKIYFLYILYNKNLFFKDYHYIEKNKKNLILQYFTDQEGFVQIPIRYIIISIWTLLF